MDIHQLYRVSYEAALAAQRISLQARYDYCVMVTSMQEEAYALQAQIRAITEEIRKLNQ